MSREPNVKKNVDSLPNSKAVGYALPTIAVAFLMGPVPIIQGIYAKYFELDLTTIGTIILIARLFDAVTDPVIGYLSDRYYANKGSRKGFIITGGMLFVISSYFLFIPNGIHSNVPYAPVSSFYFLVWFLVFYLAWTLFEIPHLAWGSELAVNTQEKNTVFSLRALGYSLGALLFYAVPLLPIFESHSFTPQTLTWSVPIACALILPFLYYCIKTVPERKVIFGPKKNLNQKKHPSCDEKKNVHYQRVFSLLLGNKPFLIVIAAFFFSGTGAGMVMALLFIFADSFLGLGEKLPLIYMLTMGASVISIGIWNKLSTILSKKTCWILGILITAIGVLGIGSLTPGVNSWLTLLFLQTLMFCGAMAGNIFTPSLLSDTIDYATWKFGQDYAGTYFSVYALIMKVNIAIGGAIGLIIAGHYKFDATINTHSPEQIFGLHLAIVYLPTLTILISLFFIALMPLNSRRNSIIRRRLDSRRDSKTQTCFFNQTKTM